MGAYFENDDLYGKRKICPLLSTNAALKPQKCYEDKCAWWNEEEKCCSINIKIKKAMEGM